MDYWVSVNDRLPEKEKMYKILLSGNKESYGYFHNGCFIKGKGIKINNVTHWEDK